MINGLSDLEAVGNQSLRNTIRYLSEFGYHIEVFTFMPKNYPDLQDPKLIFNSKVEFHRLPDVFSFVLNFGKRVKDVIGRRPDYTSRQGKASETWGTFLREYKPAGRILYLGFLFILYLPIELLRVLTYSLAQKPDLIYGVNCQGSVVAGLLGRLLKKPVVTRFHGASVSEYDLANLKNRLFVLDEIAGMKAPADAIIVTNDGTKGDAILRNLHVKEDKVHFWMNGVDIDDLSLPNGWNPSQFKHTLGLEGKKVILMASRLETWKRVDRGIRCLHKLIIDCKLENVVLLIVGDGPDRESLEKLGENLGVADSVRFAGPIPHKNVAKYYTVADIFLSLYDISNLGNPLLEAMYFGLPIVTIDDGTTDCLLKDGHNSLLVQADNLGDEMPQKVKMLLDDPSLREILGQNAKETFREKVLSWEQRIRLEDGLLKDILRNKDRK